MKSNARSHGKESPVLRQPSQLASVYSHGLLWAWGKAQAAGLAVGHSLLPFFTL